MKKLERKNIEVCAHWTGLQEPTLIGVLFATPSRGEEVFSFEYDEKWLKNNPNYNLDPSLQLYSGIQFAPQGQKNFNLFLDSAPDRWGRVLMDRREAQLAREQKRERKNLLESDYLLGVYDKQRIGALRFRLPPNDDFLDNDKKMTIHPWASLRELEYASLQLEKKEAINHKDYLKWLRMLLIQGSSLGGARPKASILDEDEQLWIAKFPSAQDKHDIGAWEMLANNLAQRAEIYTAQAKLKKFNGPYHTFLSKRFDRIGKDNRIHYASAITLLQRKDGDDSTIGASYLELAEFLIRYGANTEHDLEQLWRRIIFFICISNTDDHLRNHGFILHQDGWILSPAYDINPVSTGNGLTLNISEKDNSQDLELALEVSEYFRIKPNRANEIIFEVVKVVKEWRKEASLLKIPITEQEYMSKAFRVVDNRR